MTMTMKKTMKLTEAQDRVLSYLKGDGKRRVVIERDDYGVTAYGTKPPAPRIAVSTIEALLRRGLITAKEGALQGQRIYALPEPPSTVRVFIPVRADHDDGYCVLDYSPEFAARVHQLRDAVVELGVLLVAEFDYSPDFSGFEATTTYERLLVGELGFSWQGAFKYDDEMRYWETDEVPFEAADAAARDGVKELELRGSWWVELEQLADGKTPGDGEVLFKGPKHEARAFFDKALKELDLGGGKVLSLIDHDGDIVESEWEEA